MGWGLFEFANTFVYGTKKENRRYLGEHLSCPPPKPPHIGTVDGSEIPRPNHRLDGGKTL